MSTFAAPQALAPAAVKELIVAAGELALLDLREEGTFADGHLLFAVPMPLSRLEMMACDLVPRRDVAIVLCAGGQVPRGREFLEDRRRGARPNGRLRNIRAGWVHPPLARRPIGQDSPGKHIPHEGICGEDGAGHQPRRTAALGIGAPTFSTN